MSTTSSHGAATRHTSNLDAGDFGDRGPRDARIAELEAAMRAVEWAGKSQHPRSCPSCGAFEWAGHTAECIIGKALNSSGAKSASAGEREEFIGRLLDYVAWHASVSAEMDWPGVALLKEVGRDV